MTSFLEKKPYILILFDETGIEGIPSKGSLEHVKEYLNSAGLKFSELQFNIETIYSDLINIKPDIVFNAMHGKYGEDGRLQGLLDIMRIPYTHDNHFVSSVGFNKNYTKSLMIAAGVPVAEGILVSRDEVLSGKYLENMITKKDFILKPNCSGSAVGLCIRGGNDLKLAITEADLSNDEEFLIEELIPGREITVLFFEKKILGSAESLSEDNEHNIYTYQSKYINDPKKSKPNVDEQTLNKLYEYSLSLANKMNVNTIGRIDFRVNNSRIVALEINTHPAIGKKSFSYTICNYNNINMFDIFEKMILNAKYNAY